MATSPTRPSRSRSRSSADDAALLQQLGPRVGDAIGKIHGVVDVQNGIENTISGPATNFQVDPIVAARLGFTPTEVAEDATSILDGLPSNDPLIANGRPYTIRVRLQRRSPRTRSTPSRTPSSTARRATRPRSARWPRSSNCRHRTKFAAKTCNACRRHRTAGGLRPGHSHRRRCSRRSTAASAPIRARRLRRHLRGTAEILP